MSRKPWLVYVDEYGSGLEDANSFGGPFPPLPGAKGRVVIGWPEVGNMINNWRGQYPHYIEAFKSSYSKYIGPENNKGSSKDHVIKMVANQLWRFAFEIQKGDIIISPSSKSGVILVGKVIGEYDTIYDGKPVSYIHMREVEWTHIIPKSDPRYKLLNKLGRLTVSQPKLTIDELEGILK